MSGDCIKIDTEETLKRLASELKRCARVPAPYGLENSKSATSNTSKTTDIKPTNTNHPTNAAGLPPDLPVATDADAVDAGMMVGVPASADA